LPNGLAKSNFLDAVDHVEKPLRLAWMMAVAGVALVAIEDRDAESRDGPATLCFASAGHR
jgi:hypothetical protein